jgi:hypothetical protein
MSYDSQELTDFQSALAHPATAAALRILRLVARGTVFFVFAFTEIVAELMAPILLICGFGWALLPRILAMVNPDGQARDMIRAVTDAIPQELHVAGLSLTPSSLIVDGLLLISLVALCRTLQTVVSTER